MYKIYILVILLLCTLCACSADDHTTFPTELSKEQNSISCVFSVTDHETLVNTLNSRPSVADLHKRVGLDFLKPKGEGFFTICKTEKGLVYIAFDSKQIYAYAKVMHVAEGLCDEDFESLPAGTPLSTVQEMDPNGDYSFLYVSSQGNPAISNHYLENGYQYKIFYDENYCILRIEKEFL